MKHALLLVSLIATQAQTQIIYTDVVPDTTLNVSGDTCHLDLDNNGQADFKLCQLTLPGYCVSCLTFTSRGKACPGLRAGVQAKGKSEMGMYFVQFS